ncbi:flagellar export chaperone FliS [bacterium]|nr:flagellar export chaperone FliS [bacterium]
MPPVNPYNKYIKQYQANNVNTATPEKLMILLFDGAIQFLQKAKTCINENNYQERSQNIEGARKIIRELMRTIDLENGNDVSKRLFRLYNRMAMNLIKANVQRSTEKVDEVITDLTNIRWGFQKAIEIQSGITTVEEVMKEQMASEPESVNPVLNQTISQEESQNAG